MKKTRLYLTLSYIAFLKELHANSTTHNQTCYCNILITNNIEQCNMLQSINSQPYYKPDSSAQW